ncbi:haloacid dehalogenase type II [Gluconacetobacter azotocaptans]|uniref:Haloacid dehalogenase type II n=1 Tax=Gluconacetobacter azotocaptans TaxID=142834 RepID=A0A7W4PEJ2_9PROT|nr:haloacid dehalogenase type II [Gluconacetobacter azotocaptans]MBB2190798.1 haloacid dehalogenase type II [Gluconacetobacter azotocaptans]MBM9400756.1 haloacid dehalogenase type II [Gluconacetobacter azotocaptans]
MHLTDFKVLAFDCYGTLIDWETGIYTALQPLLAKLGNPMSRDQALEIFARHESDQEEQTPEMIYSDLLGVVYRRLAAEWNVAVTEAEALTFGGSVADWPAFPDSVEALDYLKRYYKLVILSNVDRESFRASNRRLQVEFDAIYTAQDIGSYKPSPRNFAFLVSHVGAMGFAKPDILMTAQSLFHDHVQANRIGIASAWIDRRHATEGWGATMEPETLPHLDFHFRSMGELVEAHKRECAAQS